MAHNVRLSILLISSYIDREKHDKPIKYPRDFHGTAWQRRHWEAGVICSRNVADRSC